MDLIGCKNDLQGNGLILYNFDEVLESALKIDDIIFYDAADLIHAP